MFGEAPGDRHGKWGGPPQTPYAPPDLKVILPFSVLIDGSAVLLAACALSAAARASVAITAADFIMAPVLEFRFHVESWAVCC